MLNEGRNNFLAELASKVSTDSPILGDVAAALGPRSNVQTFFVRPETVFDQDSVYDSIAAFAVTGNRLLVVVSDVSYEFNPQGEFITTTQFVNLDSIKDFQIVRSRVADGPEAGALASVRMRLRWERGGSTIFAPPPVIIRTAMPTMATWPSSPVTTARLSSITLSTKPPSSRDCVLSMRSRGYSPRAWGDACEDG